MINLPFSLICRVLIRLVEVLPMSLLLIGYGLLPGFGQVSNAQTISLEGNFEQASLDRYGNIYVATEGGVITKYDQHGELEVVFSSEKPARATLLEAWHSITIFAFYQGFQEYLMLNRFLSPADNLVISSTGIFALMATPAADGNIWLFDQVGYRLVKYAPKLKMEVSSTPLDLALQAGSLDIRFMREYQNQLFICDYASGIHIFDLMGSPIKTIDAPRLNWFGFSGDYLYFLQSGNLVKINLYSGKVEKIAVALEEVQQVLLLPTRIVCFTQTEAIFLPQ